MITPDSRPVLDVIAEALEARHFDGSGCGTDGVNGCAHCYGPSPMSAREIAEVVLAACQGATVEQQAELRPAVRCGVFSYPEGRWYVSDPADRESAERNRDLLRADGEACDVVDEPTGLAMQNAVAHVRHPCREEQS